MPPPRRATLICAWAEEGADAMGPGGELVHADACPPETLVDTLGAGDTFNAAVIFALSGGGHGPAELGGFSVLPLPPLHPPLRPSIPTPLTSPRPQGRACRTRSTLAAASQARSAGSRATTASSEPQLPLPPTPQPGPPRPAPNKVPGCPTTVSGARPWGAPCPHPTSVAAGSTAWVAAPVFLIPQWYRRKRMSWPPRTCCCWPCPRHAGDPSRHPNHCSAGALHPTACGAALLGPARGRDS